MKSLRQFLAVNEMVPRPGEPGRTEKSDSGFHGSDRREWYILEQYSMDKCMQESLLPIMHRKAILFL